jgi:2-oxo-3-hexenedioate decarboxylase
MIRLTDGASLTEPLSRRDEGFGIAEAYAVSREVLTRRQHAGWLPLGRKIGFTNRTIYDEYGVYEPIFGYMYDRTVHEARHEAKRGAKEGEAGLSGELALASLAQPRIEPEILFHLRRRPSVTDDPGALLGCTDWLAHGFEIVQCHYPDWKFKVADTIADGGLHGAYIIGPRLGLTPGDENSLIEQLASFRISLSRDGTLVAEGGGALVLGSPLNALAHLIAVIQKLPDHPRLEAGEIVTTGTLTAAMPVTAGETWSTQIEGLPLPGFELRLREPALVGAC